MWWINTTLAQTDDAMQNLVESEAKLQELNQQLVNLQDEYLGVVNNIESASFFNFDNVYFWFVLAGLLLLLFVFWFWLMELKKPKKLKVKENKVKQIIAEEKESVPPANKSPKRKVVKVMVRKVTRRGSL